MLFGLGISFAYIMKERSHDCWTVAALFVNELIDCPLLAVIRSSNP